MTQGPATLRASNASATEAQSAPRALSPSVSTTTGSSVGQKTPQTSSASLSSKPSFGGGQNAPQTTTASSFGAPSADTGQSAPKTTSFSWFGNAPIAGTGQDAPKTSTSPFTLRPSQGGLFGSLMGTTNQDSNGTLPSDSTATGGGLFRSSTPTPSRFGSKIIGGGFGSTGGPGSTDGFGGSKCLFDTGASPLSAKSDVGGLVDTGTTFFPRASNLFQDVPGLSKQTQSNGDVSKGNEK